MIYLMKTVWKYAGKDRWQVVLFHILHSISLCGELLKPYAFGRAINALQINGINNLEPTIMWMLVYLGGFFQFEIFHRIGQYFVISTAMKNQKRFNNAMYKRLYNLPMEWHVDHHSGNVVNRINVAGMALRDFGFSQQEFVEQLFLSIGPIIILMGISWKIALISLGLMTINLIAIRRMNKIIEKILERQTEGLHRYSAQLIDFVSNIRTIISLKLGKRTEVELDNKFNYYYKESMSEFKVNQVRCFMIGFGLIAIELIIIGYYLWSHKTANIPIMVGNLVMIVNYIRQMSDSFGEIISSFYETLEWKAALRSVNPILEGTKNKVLSINRGENISWDNVSIKDLNFQYSHDKATLTNINMDISKNSKIAVVGLSGSGKSTLINLLAGFYQPDNMKVTVDNQQYSDLGLIANTAIVASQDAEIFENTILSNITFGLKAESSEIEKVIHMAGLDDVIEKLPEGLNTDIREKGVNLSGGEKQRISLARTLFFSKSKKVLLFDEITSNVDAFNERLIFKRILENYKERTVICTIHRLHLLEMFDKVLVMDNGHIVQKGNFKELINTRGHFKDLWEKYLTSDDNFKEVNQACDF